MGGGGATTARRAASRPVLPSSRYRLSLLGAFSLARVEEEGIESPVTLPVYAQRLLAFLVLRSEQRDRLLVASSLWLDADEARASASLRTTLWRIRQLDEALVEGDGRLLSMGACVSVDFREAVADAQHLLSDHPAPLMLPAWSAFRTELLPEWYDDWVIFERERYRQLRLHALEILALHLSRQGRHAEAIDAAQAAVAAEPLRETAQRTLVTVHLAEGNRSEARRQLAFYRDQLHQELGPDAEPSAQMLALVSLPSEAGTTGSLTFR